MPTCVNVNFSAKLSLIISFYLFISLYFSLSPSFSVSAHEWDALELLYQTRDSRIENRDSKFHVKVVCLPKIMTCLEVQIAHFLSGSSSRSLSYSLTPSLLFALHRSAGLARHVVAQPQISFDCCCCCRLSRPDDASTDKTDLFSLPPPSTMVYPSINVYARAISSLR